MTAVNCLMPNIPKFEMVKVPPTNSCGCSLPSLAFAANSETDALMATRPYE